MARGITRKQAEKILATVKEMFPYDADAFHLYPAEHENLPKGSWSIAAEGVYVNDDDWTAHVLQKDWESRRSGAHPKDWLFPPIVFMEPLAGWNMALYPNNG